MAATEGLRERKKRETREAIARAAWKLFVRRGFDAVTVADIARAANVSEKTVFNYFPTKEDLVYWRMESFEDELLETIRTRAPGESVVEAFGRFVSEPRGLVGARDPEARERHVLVVRRLVIPPADMQPHAVRRVVDLHGGAAAWRVMLTVPSCSTRPVQRTRSGCVSRSS